jgi:hypothetical protein
VAAAALACVVTCAAPPVLAQPKAGGGGNPFDGEWSLVLDITTAPGGAVIALEGGTIPDYNTAYHAAKEQFHVKEDGSIEWAQSDAGSVYHNGTLNVVGLASQFWGERKLHLRAAGKAQTPRTANGELRAEDRRLTLDLTMIGGGGYASASGAYTTTFVANIDDREVIQFPGAIRAPNPPWILTWQDLKPTRVTEEELGLDVIRQTFTYEATRQIRVPEEVAGTFNPLVTERLEIKHVHYPRLVPRG